MFECLKYRLFRNVGCLPILRVVLSIARRCFMRRALSLSEFAARLHISARAVWQLFLLFPRFLEGQYDQGPFLLLSPATQDRVASILDLKRKGWSEDEIRTWLERTADQASTASRSDGAPTSVAPASVTAQTSLEETRRPNVAPLSAENPGVPATARASLPTTGMVGRPAEGRPRAAVEEELLVWKRLVDMAIQPFLGRIDALARDVRTLRRSG